MSRDFMSQHKKNIVSESAVTKNKIEAGNIVRFNYSGKEVHTPRPLVLVLNPNYQGKFHGLKIDYIPDTILIKLQKIIKETRTAKLQKLLKLRLPLLKPDIQDPYKFYYRRLKQFIGRNFKKGDSPYRQYTVTGISSTRIIDYRLADLFVPDDLKEK